MPMNSWEPKEPRSLGLISFGSPGVFHDIVSSCGLPYLKGLEQETDYIFSTLMHCVFCHDHEESHNHLFFACSWTSLLWMKIKSWLGLNRGMTTINSAIRGLHLKGKIVVTRMKRVSLNIVVYLIWEERNKRVFENSSSHVEPIFQCFQVLFYMILRFHQCDPLTSSWSLWLWHSLVWSMKSWSGFLGMLLFLKFLNCCFVCAWSFDMHSFVHGFHVPALALHASAWQAL